MDMGKVQAEIQAGRMPKFGPQVDASHAEYTFMSLKDLIALAYDVKAYQITGPDWLPTERFDILAKMPEGATASIYDRCKAVYGKAAHSYARQKLRGGA